jgi:hypothetical protein
MKGDWNKGTKFDTKDEGYATQPKALMEVLDRIKSHARARHDDDQNSKSVINMSWGKFSFWP